MNASKLCSYFGVKGDIVSLKQIGNGHINGTYRLIVDDNGRETVYVVQRINHYVFSDPVRLMENVSRVTEHIRNRYISAGVSPERLVLEFMSSSDGSCCFIDNGEYFRCYRFIDGSVTYELPDTPKLLEGIGGAFGNFHRLLSDFDSSTLYETIPDFHNTAKRLDALFEALEKDPYGRAAEIKSECAAYREEAELATSICRASLPIRVTHNDAKCNNVLFDEKSGEALAVIDLDTVMPGPVAHDFGDAVRSACNNREEDDPDYAAVALDVDKFKAFAKGYIAKAGDFLLKEERESLAVGVFVLAAELSARFMTDYINGDRYFAKNYGNHNMVRALSQLALAKDVKRKLPELEKIIKSI